MSFSSSDFSEWLLLAEGGEAQVFRARQASLDRLVAIKRLKLSAIGQDEDIKRFEREAKLSATLSHPSLVQIHDYGRDARYYYQVMEYVAGADLGRLAGGQGEGGAPLPMPIKVHMARQMVEVVEFIHQKGILHRDLKPENFMADADGRIKLLDLGMARGSLGTHTDAKGGLIKGTMAYLPPELLRGRGPWTRASEYHCLALVLFELFGDTRLQQGRSADELLGMIQTGIPPEAFPAVPLPIAALLAPYLNPDPALRPGSLEPLVREFRRLQDGTGALSGGRAAPDAAVRRERRDWLWSLAAAQEQAGGLEDAFARLKELLEVEPDDPEAREKLQALGNRLNQIPSSRPASLASSRSRPWALAGAIPFLLLCAGLLGAWIFYIQRAPEAEEMGQGLMEKEMNLLSRESEAPRESAGPKAAPASRVLATPRPTIRPYGVLVINGLPEGYQVLVNRVRYPAGGEIHLPASRHLLEIQDAGRNPVTRDSVTVGGGEPTVYDYARVGAKGARKTTPPSSERAGKP
jgi:tRNA A-37 threonylcarbamoyl transferase component Bud32